MLISINDISLAFFSTNDNLKYELEKLAKNFDITEVNFPLKLFILTFCRFQ